MATPKKQDFLILLHWRKVEAFLRKNYGKASLVRIADHFGLDKDEPKFKDCVQGMIDTGKAEIIEWHEGFKNLGFRTYEKNNNVTVFQKEPFLLHNQTATDFNEMLSAYENVATCV